MVRIKGFHYGKFWSKFLTSLGACILGILFLTQTSNHKETASPEILQVTSLEKPFELKQHADDFTKDAIQKVHSTHLENQADTAFKLFHKVRSNIFFDQNAFFKKLNLRTKDVESFKTILSDFNSLKDVEIFKGGDVPKIIDERMSLIDFLGDYVLEKESDESTSAVVESFISLLGQDIGYELSPKLKRIIIAEKMDLIRTLTLIDHELALHILNSLDSKQRGHLKTNYFIGLKALDLSVEDYSLLVSQVHK